MEKFELLELKLKEERDLTLEIGELMVIRNLFEQLDEGNINLDYDNSLAEIDDNILRDAENIAEEKSRGWGLYKRLKMSCDNKIDSRENKLTLVRNELEIIRNS